MIILNQVRNWEIVVFLIIVKFICIIIKLLSNLIVELFFLIAKFLKDSQFKNAFEVRYNYIFICIFKLLIYIITLNYE